MGVYSREKTVSRFLHKLSEDPERIKNNVRPFIEKKLQEMLALIREKKLALYQKQGEVNCCMPIMPTTYIHMTLRFVSYFR